MTREQPLMPNSGYCESEYLYADPHVAYSGEDAVRLSVCGEGRTERRLGAPNGPMILQHR